MKRSEFLKETILWANGILSEPNYVMPNSKNSHDVALEEQEVAEEELYHMQLDGKFYSDCTFAGYSGE